ncbi:hypothetical protein VE02_10232 [Pseudogymnoascus sp. 03VT05]|nr:hypothetical protein VE02_10232 [Pseudogymnoascus sp. 03VT05]
MATDTSIGIPLSLYDIPVPFSQRSASILEQPQFVGYSGEEILHDVLLKNGVKHIFGSQHSTWQGRDPFVTIYKAREFQSFFPRHEQGAGHMAEGYARATGKPGVVLVTGTGLTNMVTPMQDALSDGTPMVVLCGQAISAPGVNPFDELKTDVIGVSKACTKWNIRVSSIADLPRRINEAFEITLSGRPGPVLVELPSHVTSGILTKSIPPRNLLPQYPLPAALPAFPQAIDSLDQTLDRVARLVNMAKKPVLYVGQGMLTHPEGASVLKEFSDKTSIPVTTSLQGLGAFDELDRKALHMLGLHGAAYANLAIQDADLIIACGARFDDRITGSIPKFAPKALLAAAEGRGGIVHFEIVSKNVNKVVQATEAVLGDCAANLNQLIPRVQSVADRPEWFAMIDSWKARFPLTAYKGRFTPGQIKAQEVIEKLSDMTKSMKIDTIISTGVGQHQMYTAQHFRWQTPRSMITSGGLGTMGYGLPAAIGAKVARPDCLVVDIDGDASFNMTMNELLTAAQYNIGVKVILCNNGEMGMVSDLQRLYFKGRFAHNRGVNPDFVLASEAFGVPAKRCIKPEDIDAKLKWLLEHDGPALLEVITESNSPVWPVVPAGKGLHEFITYPEVL